MGHLNLEAPRSLKPVLIRHETVSVEIPGMTEKNFEDHKIKLSDREQLSLQHFNLHQCQSGHQADLKASTCSLLWVVSGLCSAQHLQTLILCITESTQGLQQSAALHTRPQTPHQTPNSKCYYHGISAPSCEETLDTKAFMLSATVSKSYFCSSSFMEGRDSFLASFSI